MSWVERCHYLIDKLENDKQLVQAQQTEEKKN